MKTFRIALAGLVATTILGGVWGATCEARTVLRNICRVKGQEENTLHGLGLVVGLAGTGEAGDAATMRALARSMEIMGAPIPELPVPGSNGLKELEKVKNAAMVVVTARIPAAGARRGDKLDCHVAGLNGKSLNGGRLVFAALKGPNINDKRIYALCEGAVHLEDPTQPLTGIITGGCQMEEDVFTPFVQNNCVTLVLDEHHANFQTATEVAEAIHAQYAGQGDSFAKAISASNIIVQVPEEYKNDPVAFTADVLEVTVYSAEPEARVVINQKTGSIVISGDVTIGDVVVSHKNVVVEAGATGAVFSPVDTDQAADAKLQSLVTALNSIKVPHEDVVEIIKGIAQNGKLHGRLIVE
jgi:flagellar P-ring protein precursor FlgI